MADVKWFKVLTDIFADDKIKIIQSMPEGDALLVMWFKVLAQAGKTNDGGYIYLRKEIPYTPGMLATLFGKQQQLVEMALQTFTQFGMIDMDDRGYIFVTNWEKHQAIDKLEKIREQSRARVQRHREAKRQELMECNVTVTQNVTPSYAIELDLDLDKEIDLDLEKDKDKRLKDKRINSARAFNESTFPEASGKFPENPPEEERTEGPAPDDNPHKDKILKLLNECQIQNFTLFDLDNIYAYIGVVDLEVIEAAIKKSQGKKGPYVTATLRGMARDGITRAEHLLPKLVVGSKHITRSGKPKLAIADDSPAPVITPEQRQAMREKAYARSRKEVHG